MSAKESDLPDVELPSVEELEQRSIINLINKLNAGGILTPREEKKYEDYMARKKADAHNRGETIEESASEDSGAVEVLPASEDTQGWADYWGVTIRTLQRWKKGSLPYANPEAMAHIIKTGSKFAPGAKKKAMQVLEGGVKLARVRSEAKTGKGDEAASELDGYKVADPYELREYYGKLIKQSLKHNAPEQAVRYEERFFASDKAIREIELHAQKMGRQHGEMVARAEFEAILWAFIWWLMRGMDLDIKQLAPKLVKLDFPEEAEFVLDNHWSERRIVEPLARAAASSALNVPKWVVDFTKDAVDDFFENGAEDFNAWMRKHREQHQLKTSEQK